MDRLVRNAAAPTLPPLREDLRAARGSCGKDGAPAWSIQDPVTNRFFRIGWLEFECLLRWPGNPEKIAQDIAATTSLAADKELVEDFASFPRAAPLGASLSGWGGQARRTGQRARLAALALVAAPLPLRARTTGAPRSLAGQAITAGATTVLGAGVSDH